MNKKRIPNFGVVGLAILGMSFTACDKDKDLQEWMNHTAQLRVAAEDRIGQLPYRAEQHQAFKAYYGELNQMALALKNDAKLKERFNRVLSKADMGAACAKVFTPKADWRELARNCRKNRFFLCAEEVRAYPDLVKAMRNALNTSLKKRFDNTAACRDAVR